MTQKLMALEFPDVSPGHDDAVWMFAQAAARFILILAFDEFHAKADDMLDVVEQFIADDRIRAHPAALLGWERLQMYLRMGRVVAA